MYFRQYIDIYEFLWEMYIAMNVVFSKKWKAMFQKQKMECSIKLRAF